MTQFFEIDGYFVDDGSEFSNYIVVDTHSTFDTHIDEQIFFYGLSEEGIKLSMEKKEPVAGEFIITKYQEVEL